MHEPKHHTRQGCELSFRTIGAGPRVLFIQGTAVHGDGWAPQVEDLGRDHRCLWFDNRGIGASQPRGDAPITVAELAEDALALLDAEGWPDAHVVGHSLGGVISLELALRAPARVRSLSLLCTGADGRALTGMGPAMLWRGLRMELGTRRSRRRAFLELVLSRAETARLDLDRLAEELAPRYGHDLAIRPPIAMRQVLAMRGWDVSRRLSELAGIPTLVVGADEDLIARPDTVRALAGGIPGARLVELDGAAHGVTLTQPERINRLLREHVAAVEAAGAAAAG